MLDGQWPAAHSYLAALTPEARRTLLGILTSPSEVRAAAIGRLSIRDDGADLAELLIELEEKEWARQWFVIPDEPLEGAFTTLTSWSQGMRTPMWLGTGMARRSPAMRCFSGSLAPTLTRTSWSTRRAGRIPAPLSPV